ncbi:protein of unknown function DUF169 [Gottschalkia purinilytica]|uniref:DUF169 domain-containing protein n=1 Tax=Gottschalkia purinilytica TaxID=1503 RepID=A0A0L0W8U8_GOTPU|nr:DUF169 domain-containing protein [Gottschalkia purinilytica]KNF07887.1 protein of unknown function DUF169 [Gottschalkia purinilytica]
MSPYKSDKILYGSPNKTFPIEDVKEAVENLEIILGLNRKPVGVKLIFSKEEYDKLKEEEIKGKTSYCVMIEKATREFSFKSRYENHNCDGGTTALALEPSTERIESGEEYFSYNLYSTNATAHRMRKSIKSLHRCEFSTYGLLTKPLDKFDIVPDVVIIIANPYQVMRLTQGYVYHLGIKPELDYGAMQAICSESTVVPYLTGSMNISTLCPSTRMLAKWKDEEMAAGIPYEKFLSTVEGVIATINTTDMKKKKEDIISKFKEKGKNIDLTLDNDYEV